MTQLSDVKDFFRTQLRLVNEETKLPTTIQAGDKVKIDLIHFTIAFFRSGTARGEVRLVFRDGDDRLEDKILLDGGGSELVIRSMMKLFGAMLGLSIEPLMVNGESVVYRFIQPASADDPKYSLQTSAKHRLRHLSAHMSDANRQLIIFSSYLADNLERHGDFSPEHFILSYNNAVDQIRLGGTLKGQTFSDADCDHLFVMIATITSAIFPEEFATPILERVGNRTA